MHFHPLTNNYNYTCARSFLKILANNIMDKGVIFQQGHDIKNTVDYTNTLNNCYSSRHAIEVKGLLHTRIQLCLTRSHL